MVSKDVLEKPAIVAGGGAPEAYGAAKLREWTSTLSGREQLAAEKFADALEVIPLSLAENAGMDPIDTLTDLRSKQSKGQQVDRSRCTQRQDRRHEQVGHSRAPRSKGASNQVRHRSRIAAC